MSQLKLVTQVRPSERNKRRVERMKTWIDLAQGKTSPDHVRFVFYWIAFEAGYLRQPDSWRRPGGSDGQVAFLHDVSKAGRLELQKVISQYTSTADNLFELRWANGRFWYNNKWGNIIKGKSRCVEAQQEAWEKLFQSRIQSVKQKWRNAANDGGSQAIAEALLALFDVLKVVRHQIMHGGSAGANSLGKRQVELGTELLGALVPLFQKIIEARITSDWGIPPFPHVFPGIKPNQKIPPPWLLKGNRNIKTRRR